MTSAVFSICHNMTESTLTFNYIDILSCRYIMTKTSSFNFLCLLFDYFQCQYCEMLHDKTNLS